MINIFYKFILNILLKLMSFNHQQNLIIFYRSTNFAQNIKNKKFFKIFHNILFIVKTIKKI